MKIKIIVTTGFLLIASLAWGQSTTRSDAAILDMATAFKKGDAKTVAQLQSRVKENVLEPWAAYWQLKLRLEDKTRNVDQSDLDAFFVRHKDTYVEDRLRADWLLLLGKNQDWQGFDVNYAAYRMRDDKDILCYAQRDSPAVVEKLWMSQKEAHSGCGDMATALIDAGKMPLIVSWRKTFNPGAPHDDAWSPPQINWALGFEGRALAQQLDLSALDVFAKVSSPTDLSDDMLGWWARAALRAQDWRLVVRVIGAMSDDGRQDATWVYWLGVARQTMQGKPSASFLVSQLDFAKLPLASPATEEATATIKGNRGLQRALYAIRIGLRSEGVREWNYEINLAKGRMGDTERLAAAALACEAEVWDRCINTSEGTKAVIDWAQRYPTPHKESLMVQAQNAKVDPAFVYGLIRQESRFVTDANSSVGAAGLMQLMPATAKWTAKHIGLTDYSKSKIRDVETNLMLGVAYLKYVLDSFNGEPALAAAAYNAGPNRVRAWQAAMAKDPAAKLQDAQLAQDIWIENIPFTETRNYVKKVSANTAAYRQVLVPAPIQ